MSHATNPSDHEPEREVEPDRVYRQLRERNARQQLHRQQKVERLVEQNAHRGPQPFRHPSR
ncbi:MAG: hypothetical protein ABSH51_07290 [Solirubrobacteraceae bacterium]|jgi:hypothetical protein